MAHSRDVFEERCMRAKRMSLSNFGHAVSACSYCYRPDKERDLSKLFKPFNTTLPTTEALLMRGNGLSYSDCCLNHQGIIVDSTRLNQLIAFNEEDGSLTCQAGVSFADLFLLSPNYIPPVIPGTLKASIAGGIANDVHGKNNPHEGTFGRHVQGFELCVNERIYYCSQEENSELFHATIGGLGLTGAIKRIRLKLKKASRVLQVQTTKFTSWESLLTSMAEQGVKQDYQVAWLDLLNPQKALLSVAHHIPKQAPPLSLTGLTVPRLPCRLVSKWTMQCFNQLYFRYSKANYQQTLNQFNNPLDAIGQWTRLYGKQGLLQFQALVPSHQGMRLLNDVMTKIQRYAATPTLAVLKLFTESGAGLLSFVEPGFTLAIDFVNCPAAKKLIPHLNEMVCDMGGKIYLAKDLFLTGEQFRQQYTEHQAFTALLSKHSPHMASDLSRRLGIT